MTFLLCVSQYFIPLKYWLCFVFHEQLSNKITDHRPGVFKAYWGSLFQIIMVSVDISVVKIVHSSVEEARINLFRLITPCVQAIIKF